MATARRIVEEPPAYSIRVVAAETGIPAETLRAWERRYGFPKPTRRPGGSRLYGQEHVTRLRLIARARDAGYRPGDVIPLPDRDIQRLVEGAPQPTAALSSVHTVASLIDRLRVMDAGGLRTELRTLAATLGPRRFVTDLAQPLAVRIGDAWERGELDVHHEHLASGLLSAQLQLLLSLFDDAAGAPVAVLATLPGESHTLGLDMVAVYLASQRVTPRLLGGSTPPDQVARAAAALDAKIVGVSISSATDLRRAKAGVEALRSHLEGEREIWLGGAGAERLQAMADERRPRVRLASSWQEIDAALAGSLAR